MYFGNVSAKPWLVDHACVAKGWFGIKEILDSSSRTNHDRPPSGISWMGHSVCMQREGERENYAEKRNSLLCACKIPLSAAAVVCPSC